MKKVLSISEIVQDLDLEVEPKELCAAADADYDERNSTLVIKLDAFVRQVHRAGPDVCSRPDWLPKAETLREGVAPDKPVTWPVTSSGAGRKKSASPPRRRKQLESNGYGCGPSGTNTAAPCR